MSRPHQPHANQLAALARQHDAQDAAASGEACISFTVATADALTYPAALVVQVVAHEHVVAVVLAQLGGRADGSRAQQRGDLVVVQRGGQEDLARAVVRLRGTRRREA